MADGRPILLEYRPAVARVPREAQWAFVCGIGSLTLWPLVYWLPTFLFLALFCTLAGLGLGMHWSRRISAEPARYVGRGYTTAAIWIAVLGALVGLLMLAVAPLLMHR